MRLDSASVCGFVFIIESIRMGSLKWTGRKPGLMKDRFVVDCVVEQRIACGQ